MVSARQARFIRSAIKAARSPWTGLLTELAYGPPSRNVWIRAYQRTRWNTTKVPAIALLRDPRREPVATGSISIVSGPWRDPVTTAPVMLATLYRHGRRALPAPEDEADRPAPRGRHRRPKHSLD